jgi:ferredoxin-thioredoxin reductase catalytic chain
MKHEPNFDNEKFQTVINSMRIFAEGYAKSTNTYFCTEDEITQSVIIGLAKNKMETGAALCPCRCYINKEEEGKLAYWNCPCIPMRERKECHCMLFLTEDNMFASNRQEIDINLSEYKT